MDQIFKNGQGGYIALISAIIISIILVGITFTVSRAGYFSRFASLDAENKRISKGLAESCVNEALLRMAQNANYSVGNESITVDASVVPPLVCKIDSIVNPAGYDANNQKIATITASASYPAENGTFSQIVTTSTIQDPAHRAPAKIVVNAYSYGAGAKSPDQFGPFGVNGTPVSLGVSEVFPAGAYHITQANGEPTKYKTAFAGDCDSSGNLTLGVNDYKTCNILNTIRPQTAKLTIIIASSDGTMPVLLTFNGASLTPQATQAISLETELNADGTDKAFAISLGIDAVHYTTSEWSGTDCAGVYDNGQVTLKKGDNKVCAVSYNKRAQDPKAALTVVTRVTNYNGGSAQPGDFNVSIAAAGMSLQSETSDSESKTVTYYIDPGTFKVTEDDKANYQKNYNDSGYPYQCVCDASNSCAVTEGKSYLCLITNTDIPTTFVLTAVVNVNRPYGVAPVPESMTIKLNTYTTMTSGVPIGNLMPGDYQLKLSGIPGGYLVGKWGSDCTYLGSTGIVSYDPLVPAKSKRFKTCTIEVKEIPPPFHDVDTLMMLDRTGSMFTNSNWIGGERVAAKSLLNLFSGLSAPRPQVGIGVFANDSGNSAQIAGNLTEDYGSETATTPVVTGTLFPSNQGNYTAWTNGEATVDETGTPSCSNSDSIVTATADNRESVRLDLSSIPNGSVITSVDVITYDRGDTSADGTYKTFVRLSGSNTDAAANLTATGAVTGCNAKTQSIDVVDVAKSGTTTLEAGVVKVSGNNNAVRVGVIRAIVHYTISSSGLYLAVNSGLANTHGGTDISAAISQADGELNSGNHIVGHKKFLILLSDGEPTYPSGGGYHITQGDVDAAYVAADNAKQISKQIIQDYPVEIYTIHFGGVTTLPNGESSRDLLAELATGTVMGFGSQPGSHNDVSNPTDQTQIDSENNDGDHFFIVPVTADPTAAMTAIFNKIGQQIISGSAPPAIHTGTLNIITHVVNNNGHTMTAGNFQITVSGTNPTQTLAGQESPGTELTLNPGNYQVSENPDSDYVESIEPQCTGNLVEGQEVTCVIVNDDTVPATPPLPEPPPAPPAVGAVPATLVVVTQVNNDSGTAGKSASDFSFSIDNPASASHQGSETGVNLENLLPQPYSVTASIDSAYSVSQSGDCSASTIVSGQTNTCVIIYTANPPSPPPIDAPDTIDINSWREE